MQVLTANRGMTMKESEEHVRTVTTKGQVTIPAEIRRLLEVEPGDKVIFPVTGGYGGAAACGYDPGGCFWGGHPFTWPKKRPSLGVHFRLDGFRKGCIGHLRAPQPYQNCFESRDLMI